MPLYDYECTNLHRVEYLERADATTERRCPVCGTATRRLFPAPHVAPDGVYSYAPNIGDPRAFEERRQHIREHGITPRAKELPHA